MSKKSKQRKQRERRLTMLAECAPWAAVVPGLAGMWLIASHGQSFGEGSGIATAVGFVLMLGVPLMAMIISNVFERQLFDARVKRVLKRRRRIEKKRLEEEAKMPGERLIQIIDASREHGVLMRLLRGGQAILLVRDPANGAILPKSVPPDMKTSHEARAWTFGLTPDQFQPDEES